MDGRTGALVATLALIGLLGFLTIDVMIREGIDILVIASLGILALFGLGVVGALTNSPKE